MIGLPRLIVDEITEVKATCKIYQMVVDSLIWANTTVRFDIKYVKSRYRK
jgi:hypothetical protein